jgi:hypothetical protein
MDYRHGLISITAPGRVAWMFGAEPKGLPGDVAATGGGHVGLRRLPGHALHCRRKIRPSRSHR